MKALTHLRTMAITIGAFALCCGLVTQMLARALGYAPELGPALMDLGSLRLYAPFAFLGWTLAWAPAAPSLLVLALCMACVCALAAYAVAIVVARVEPIALSERSPWRDLATWRELGHRGLLRDVGLALGAVRRHPWSKHRIVRSDARALAFLGQSEHTDEAVLAALQSWPGTMVLVTARGSLAERLGREGVSRFAPGRGDALSVNPMLAIRGGPHAWDDARRLASSLLGHTRAATPTTVDAFALLMLDQLLCAPLEARTLAALRRRLIDPTALVANLCGRWTAEPTADAAPASWEMVRVARTQRSDPDRALADFVRIDQALAIFADASLALATGAHQLNLAEFVSRPAPQTLVLSMELAGAAAAPLAHALLAQLSALHAGATNVPDSMVAVEADAARILAEQFATPLPLGANARLLVQTTDVAETERLLRSGESECPIVAIGPQSDRNAQSLSRRAGKCSIFGPLPHGIPRWRRLLFPTWIEQEVERLPAPALEAASPSEAFLIAAQQKPVRMAVLVGGGSTRFIASPDPARHDWRTPPADKAPSPDTAAIDVASHIPPGPAASKLRRVLTRAAPTAGDKGARMK